MTATSETDSAYHHGDLPNALKAAAAEVIVERGPSGFSLREVARRAGVSHAAPAHHFGDSTGLLTALAVDAFRLLDDAMTAAAAEANDPIDRLRRIGMAYVEVGATNPAHIGVVFRPDLVDCDSEAYSEWGERAYAHLRGAVEAFRDAYNPDLDTDTAARLCWSMVQGVLVLFDGMSARDEGQDVAVRPIVELVDRFTGILVDGMRHTVAPSDD